MSYDFEREMGIEECLEASAEIEKACPKGQRCIICGYTEKENDAHFGIYHLPFSKVHMFKASGEPPSGEKPE